MINDFDVVFFDSDSQREREVQSKKNLEKQFPRYKFDVKNQASFGFWREWPRQFTSTEDGINNWLHTATALGLRVDALNQLEVYAPYGLRDLFSGTVVPTPPRLGDPNGKLKAAQLLKACPSLKVIDR